MKYFQKSDKIELLSKINSILDEIGRHSSKDISKDDFENKQSTLRIGLSMTQGKFPGGAPLNYFKYLSICEIVMSDMAHPRIFIVCTFIF